MVGHTTIKRLMLLISGFLLFSSLVFPLDPNKSISQYTLDVMGIEKGLPQSTVYTVIRSKVGYIWLGTEEGLVRFDGVNFKVYDKRNVPQILNNFIKVLCEDSQGNLWIGTRGGGLVCLNAEDGKFSVFTTRQGLASDMLEAIYEDHKGVLWIGTDAGLNRKEYGESFTTYTTQQGLSIDRIRAISEDRKGNLWIGTEDGLNRMQGENGAFTRYTTHEGLSDNNITSLFRDRQGNLWIGTNSGGLNRLDWKNGAPFFTTFTNREGLSVNRVNTILDDRDGNLWIGTYGGGLNRLTKKGIFTACTIKQGLTNNIVWSLCEDPEGSLWIGTYSGGLNRLKNLKFTTYTPQEGLSNDIARVISEDRHGNIWIGTEGDGVNRLDRTTGNFTIYTTKNGLSNDMVRAIYEDNEGYLWIGTDGGGLNRLDPKNKTFTVYGTQNGLADDRIKAIYGDRGGNLWVGTERGLNRLNLKELKTRNLSKVNTFTYFSNLATFSTYTTKNGLSNDIIRYICEDSLGFIWIGTEGGGINRLDPAKGTFTTYSTKDGLTSDLIREIYEDRDGTMWIGTKNGLNRLKDGKITRITTQQGLYDDVVFRILEDDRGNIWMSCNKGIFYTSRKALNDVCDGKKKRVYCTSYDEKDGMRSRECCGSCQPAGWKTRDGMLWIPTLKGVVVVDPANIRVNHLPPPVLIEEIVKDNQQIYHPITSKEKEGKLVLSPGTERLEIHFTGLSFMAPIKMRFKYKLEGFDKDWHDSGTQRAAYYTKISPGNYTFQVVACNNDGIWNKTGASLSFYQKPYFYETTWFYLLLACGAIFLALTGFRFRVKQLTNRKKELEQLVTERTYQLERSNKELEQLSIVARETDNAVLIMDAVGNFEWVNEGFSRMYGFTLEQLLNERGKNLIGLSANPKIKDVIDRLPVEREPFRYESYQFTRAGREIWAQTTLTPIFNASGTLTKIVAIDSDITRLKQSEKQIRKKNEEILNKSLELQKAIETAQTEREAAYAANQAKSEFLARMSHEIRTPMNGIIGFTDLLLDTNLDEEQLDYARTINRSGEALTMLLNDILDFSRIEAGELVFTLIDFDPEVTAFDVLEIVLPRMGDKPLEMICRISAEVPAYVRGDAGRFRQVLINLVGNAVKFTDEGEIEISLRVEQEEKDRIKLHTTVRDTGIGIPKDKLETIFDVFQQGDGSTTWEHRGTGLGLSISRQIARLMGGNTWAESTPGQGSIFHFTAWMEKSKKTPDPKKEIAKREILAGKKALVIDRNRSNLELLTYLLELAGMRVVPREQSIDALPVILEGIADEDPVDICVVDIETAMINGVDLVKNVHKLAPPISRLPLLAISSPVLGRSGMCKESGFDGFLPKPIRGKKLVPMVEKLLAKAPTINNYLGNWKNSLDIAPIDTLFKSQESSGLPAMSEKIGQQKLQNHEPEIILTNRAITADTKHSVHILLVEDNPINRKLASFILVKAGYRLSAVEDGEKAVEVFTTAPEKFDMVFMDIQMPRMNGLEATRAIRDKGFKDIPIIAMTAQSMKGDREKFLASGMNDYIAKPIKRELVFDMVKKWCLDK